MLAPVTLVPPFPAGLPSYGPLRLHPQASGPGRAAGCAEGSHYSPPIEPPTASSSRRADPGGTGRRREAERPTTRLQSTGSVFPGYPDHTDEAERRAWRVAAARQWERLLEMRAMELSPGGWFIAALPASPAPCPERTGLYVEIIGDMNRVLADWCRAGRIGAATVAAVVIPVWMRTLDEIRRPFEAGGGRVAGLALERAELFRLDNPYWHDDPAMFARGYVQSVTAWGGPLLLRAFAREGEGRAPGLLADFLGELEERVAAAPDRYRWDYIEALVICRKADSTGGDRTRS